MRRAPLPPTKWVLREDSAFECRMGPNSWMERNLIVKPHGHTYKWRVVEGAYSTGAFAVGQGGHTSFVIAQQEAEKCAEKHK